MLTVTCPYCHTVGEISNALIGQPLTCGQCGGVFSSWGGQAEIQPPPRAAFQPGGYATGAPAPPIAGVPPALPAPEPAYNYPPVAAPVPPGPLTWQPSTAERYGRRRRRAVGPAAVNRLMLLATAGWLLGMVVTTAWLLIENSQVAKRGGALAGAAAADVVAGSLCLWLFESLAYGVVMIVLWVIRENVRE